jgi:hypothetical protein
MNPTWKAYSKQILGYEAPLTEINDIYVSTHKIQGWLDKGKKVEEILLMWNSGEKPKKCSSGVNSLGVKFNSCEYVRQGLVAYNSI